MLGVPRGVGQQPLRGVLALHQQRSERGDELVLHGEGHDPLGDLPLLGGRRRQGPSMLTHIFVHLFPFMSTYGSFSFAVF